MTRIDKEIAARRLIHAAIRNIAALEDPVANHVLVMAAHDVIREYAIAKGITTYTDMGDLFKPELKTKS